MCGIVAATSFEPVLPKVLSGLVRLEYRGYDSVGVCIQDEHPSHQVVKRVGKVREILPIFQDSNLQAGRAGIGHTRWATHGPVTDANAHPHLSGDVAVVHNGVIENYLRLKAELIAEGYYFYSDTDSEVIAHLIYREIERGATLLEAVAAALRELDGSIALAVLSKSEPGNVVGARKGSSLAVGIGDGASYLVSDAIAVADFTEKFIYLNDGDLALLSPESVVVYDSALRPVQRPVVRIDAAASASKGPFRHYMEKELHEAPDVARSLISSFSAERRFSIPDELRSFEVALENVRDVVIVACGGSRHAAVYGEAVIQELTGKPVSVSIASEFRYMKHPDRDRSGTLFVTISQSGETADTLAALELAQTMGFLGSLSICNVKTSALARGSDWFLDIGAGTEIGVASTKALTNQMICMVLLSLMLRREVGRLWDDLHELPVKMAEVLQLRQSIIELAKEISSSSAVFFIGRGQDLPVAMEAALKLKEITYKFSESYPAGELKHGPLALVDDEVSVVAISTDEALSSKTKINLEETRLRGAEAYLLTDEVEVEAGDYKVLKLPGSHRIFSPIIACNVVQFLAYDMAVLLGTDADQPRNLAKAVTVE